MTDRRFSRLLNKLLARALVSAVLFGVIGIVSSPFQLTSDSVEAQTATVLYVNPASQSVGLGSTAAVDVIIQNVANLYGAEIHLTYDPTRLSVQDASPAQSGTQIGLGPLLTSGGYFVAVNRVDDTLGTIVLALTQLNPTLPVTGSGAVAHINFQARTIGTTPIRLTLALLADRNGNRILFATDDQPYSATRARSPMDSTIQGGVISVTADSNFFFLPFSAR